MRVSAMQEGGTARGACSTCSRAHLPALFVVEMLGDVQVLRFDELQRFQSAENNAAAVTVSHALPGGECFRGGGGASVSHRELS